MRLISTSIIICALCLIALAAAVIQPDYEAQYRIEERPAPPEDGGGVSATRVSGALFADLERLARLVDITYCVGNTGIAPPFSCASRCRDFPTLRLVTTFNTGPLMGDSCGFVAVEDGGDGDKGGRDGAVIVAFRGTYSIANTVVDLSTVPQEYVPYPGPDGDGDDDEDASEQHRCTNCTVHMGFLASWAQARKVVLPVLQAARREHPGYPVHLVGHSLGGAVALLASLELRVAMRWDGVGVTTFGEPRTGNDGFVEFVDRVFGLDDGGGAEGLDGYSRPYRRVTHADDPVPLLPLAEWGYRPHAGEIFISRAELPPVPEDLRLCRGDEDPACIAGGDAAAATAAAAGLPTRLKLWQLLFAHRDYFWRLGLCVPGGDPSDWGRDPYNASSLTDEL